MKFLKDDLSFSLLHLKSTGSEPITRAVKFATLKNPQLLASPCCCTPGLKTTSLWLWFNPANCLMVLIRSSESRSPGAVSYKKNCPSLLIATQWSIAFSPCFLGFRSKNQLKSQPDRRKADFVVLDLLLIKKPNIFQLSLSCKFPQQVH